MDVGVITAMKASAEAATPGVWSYLDSGVVVNESGDDVADVAVSDDTFQDTQNGRHIAASSPANVLALIAEVPVWRPIETAPKDGTKVLLFSPGKRDAGNQNARDPHMIVDAIGGRWPKGAYQLPEAPYTHWMPLPTPPSAP